MMQSTGSSETNATTTYNNNQPQIWNRSCVQGLMNIIAALKKLKYSAATGGSGGSTLPA
jgi:hypothetical protein